VQPGRSRQLRRHSARRVAARKVPSLGEVRAECLSWQGRKGVLSLNLRATSSCGCPLIRASVWAPASVCGRKEAAQSASLSWAHICTVRSPPHTVCGAGAIRLNAVQCSSCESGTKTAHQKCSPKARAQAESKTLARRPLVWPI